MTGDIVDRRGLRDPSDPQHIPVRLPPALGRDESRSAAGLYSTVRDHRKRALRGVQALPGDQQALGERLWSEFIPFLDYDVEIRLVICSTNAIESLNACDRRAVRARGHFANDTAVPKCLYLVTRSLDPTGRGRARRAMRWKPALNAFAITFQGRIQLTQPSHIHR
jgi:hypothetical protein